MLYWSDVQQHSTAAEFAQKLQHCFNKINYTH